MPSQLVTHAATGSAVMSSPGECVERLLALHAHGHLVVPDPARGASAEFLGLENNRTSAGTIYSLTKFSE